MIVEGYIYKLTLNTDLESFKKGESYIGKHNGAKPEYYGSGRLVKKIINKYSVSVFDRAYYNLSIDQAIKQVEAEMIYPVQDVDGKFINQQILIDHLKLLKK